LLAGSSVQFENYRASLQYLAAELGVRDIHFLGQVSNEELTALYDVPTVPVRQRARGFLRADRGSVLQARAVLAYAATAVPATMDGGGVLFDSTDPVRVAATMAAMLADEATEDRILAAQDAALARLQAIDFPAVLLQYVRQALAARCRTSKWRRTSGVNTSSRSSSTRFARRGRPRFMRSVPKTIANRHGRR
jgi:hypothetical protein